MTQIQQKTFVQLLRYGIVGVMNTVITLCAIFVCKSLLGINPYVANVVGYIAGLLNAFLWNRRWVFGAKEGRLDRQLILFLIGFGVCYTVQLFVVWSLNQSSFGQLEVLIFGFTLSGYGIATIIGNVIYTICNFLYNRLIAFKHK